MGLAEEIGGARSLALYELLRQRLLKLVSVAAPAAGADWSIAVPAGVVWEPVAIAAQLLTSAVVANRAPRLQYQDGANVFVRIPANANSSASQTALWAWLADFGAPATVGFNTGSALPLPSATAAAGQTIGTSTVGIDVGDQWSAIMLLVREWQAREVLAACDWLADHTR